jgi:hypothetical protein
MLSATGWMVASSAERQLRRIIFSPGMFFATASRTLMARERTRGRLFLLGGDEADEVGGPGNIHRAAECLKNRDWALGSSRHRNSPHGPHATEKTKLKRDAFCAHKLWADDLRPRPIGAGSTIVCQRIIDCVSSQVGDLKMRVEFVLRETEILAITNLVDYIPLLNPRMIDLKFLG